MCFWNSGYSWFRHLYRLPGNLKLSKQRSCKRNQISLPLLSICNPFKVLLFQVEWLRSSSTLVERRSKSENFLWYLSFSLIFFAFAPCEWTLKWILWYHRQCVLNRFESIQFFIIRKTGTLDRLLKYNFPGCRRYFRRPQTYLRCWIEIFQCPVWCFRKRNQFLWHVQKL